MFASASYRAWLPYRLPEAPSVQHTSCKKEQDGCAIRHASGDFTSERYDPTRIGETLRTRRVRSGGLRQMNERDRYRGENKRPTPSGAHACFSVDLENASVNAGERPALSAPVQQCVSPDAVRRCRDLTLKAAFRLLRGGLDLQ